MSDQGPLSIAFNTKGIKTGKPIIADGSICKVRLADVRQQTTEKGDMIVFEYHLLDPAPTTEGKQVNPGFALLERVTLYDKDTPVGEIPERALTRISQRTDAFLGTGDEGNNKGKPPRPDFGPDILPTLIGKEAFVKVKAKVGGEYEGNDIATVIYPGDMKA